MFHIYKKTNGFAALFLFSLCMKIMDCVYTLINKKL